MNLLHLLSPLWPIVLFNLEEKKKTFFIHPLVSSNTFNCLPVTISKCFLPFFIRWSPHLFVNIVSFLVASSFSHKFYPSLTLFACLSVSSTWRPSVSSVSACLNYFLRVYFSFLLSSTTSSYFPSGCYLWWNHWSLHCRTPKAYSGFRYQQSFNDSLGLSYKLDILIPFLLFFLSLLHLLPLFFLISTICHWRSLTQFCSGSHDHGILPLSSISLLWSTTRYSSYSPWPLLFFSHCQKWYSRMNLL